MPDFKKQKLSDCIDYVNEKINIEELNDLNYISTENMLPNRGGITKSSGLPNANYTQCFSEGDILLSNIRPYFKKIWYATFNGGCSNDVLVLRAKSNMYSKFLYYVLSDDKFFEYDTATSKGTKMPRGDKVAIMKYGVPQYDLPKQKKIARVLSSLDNKIELNNKINQNLEQQAQAIFKSWFVNFEPFGGKMPEDWRIGKVEEIINIYDNQRIPLSNKERSEMTKKVYPYYGATSLMDYVDNYIFDGIYLLLGEDGTVIDDFGFPILQYVWGKFWVNNHAHIITGKNGYNVESLYLFFKQKNIKSIVTGAVQAKISQTNLKNLDAIIPTTSTMEEFNKIIAPMFNAIRNNTNEIKILTQLRDMLLPKLMSGEINVDKAEA